MKETVFITGATGTIGQRLCRYLEKQGYSIVALTRNQHKAASLFNDSEISFIEGDISQANDHSWWPAIADCDHVINLVGEPVVQRWTNKTWQRIKESRIDATNQLVTAAKASAHNLKTFISTSAIGAYGTHPTNAFSEKSPLGKDKLAQLCLAWEKAAQRASSLGCRVVIIRVGVVLDPAGGMLSRVLPIFRAGLGGKLGSGSQWLSWIHIDDLVRVYAWALAKSHYEGVINATSPIPVTNASFTASLGDVLKRPTAFRVPATAIRFALGEAANIILEGQRVIPENLSEQGFEFHHPTLQSALHQLLAT